MLCVCILDADLFIMQFNCDMSLRTKNKQIHLTKSFEHGNDLRNF